MELVCPAGNLPSLKGAVDAGANAVYAGFGNATNARHFTGLNFDRATLEQGIAYAHRRGCKLYLAINTYPQHSGWKQWQAALEGGAELGVDAFIIADGGVLEFATEHFPGIRRHLSVQASATNVDALDFYVTEYGVERAVLPRVLTVRQVERLLEQTPVEIEVFGFGSLCVMAEGRCYLSSYVTGESPNTCGVCSPAHAVQWREDHGTVRTLLNTVLIDTQAPGERVGYPTLCKGRFSVNGQLGYALESPVSLNAIELLPRLFEAGVAAVKIEGRQRSPAYVKRVSRVWRRALDACCANPDAYAVSDDWLTELAQLSEGSETTLGALHRPWQ